MTLAEHLAQGRKSLLDALVVRPARAWANLATVMALTVLPALVALIWAVKFH